MAVRGIVKKKYQKETKKPGTYIHSFQIKDDNTYYRCGFEAIKANEGDHVEFEAEEGQWGVEMVKGSLKVVEAPKTSATTASVRVAAGGRDSYWENKEKRDMQITEPMIRLQNATGIAKDIVIAALNKDIITIPGKKNGDKLEGLIAYVLEVRDQLFLSYQEAQEEFAKGNYSRSVNNEEYMYIEGAEEENPFA